MMDDQVKTTPSLADDHILDSRETAENGSAVENIDVSKEEVKLPTLTKDFVEILNPSRIFSSADMKTEIKER